MKQQQNDNVFIQDNAYKWSENWKLVSKKMRAISQKHIQGDNSGLRIYSMKLNGCFHNKNDSLSKKMTNLIIYSH